MGFFLPGNNVQLFMSYFCKSMNFQTFVISGTKADKSYNQYSRQIFTFRIQNPGILQAGRVRAAHSGAVGWGGTPTDWCAQETTVPCIVQGNEPTRPERFSEARTSKNPCKPVGRPKYAFDQRLVTGW